MFELRKHTFFNSLKVNWEDMEYTSAYQSFFVQKELAKCMPVYCFRKRYTPIYYEVLAENETKLIFPLCKYIGQNRYCILGKVNGFQIYDVIFKRGLHQKKIEEMIHFVLQNIQPASVEIVCLPEESVLYTAIMNLKEKGNITLESIQCDNVVICAEAGHDEYIKSLSKNMRQNIRTAYNRLNKAELDIRLDVVTGKTIPNKIMNETLSVYIDRHELRYGVHTSWIKKIYLKYFDFSTKCLKAYPDNFCAILYIKNEVAAFMAGVINADKGSIIIPRLSAKKDFLKYSPGVVLINETIKYMTEKMGICKLDLSKGAEQYKLSMGGKIYPTYTVKIMM